MKAGKLHYHPCTTDHRVGKKTSKLDPSVIERLYGKGLTQQQIAESFNVNQSRISQILDRTGRIANMQICRSTIVSDA